MQRNHISGGLDDLIGGRLKGAVLGRHPDAQSTGHHTECGSKVSSFDRRATLEGMQKGLKCKQLMP